ncbi:flagellar hook assembly protein FlgD [Sphingosinithalassobacter sp. CS137]|uniref:flagellar hook assembly protein FlgD n=1 Tax=Sphingosinithalassobacter sp. CS137 TaxID=2762748 RepID=UPI00292CDD22|nr:flagellar hook capping FlgD N-terminal domain-containing protein [Sphingosinithalassobacter sp. CS137]
MSSFDSTLATLGIGRTTPSNAATASANTANLGRTEMDQSDFLTLMTAQLKNQDPFEPVDNSQMVAQMAQFSSLAGISEMNSTLKAISERLGGTTTADALSWVGKTVLVEGDTAYPRTDGTMGGTIVLGADASDVTVTIENGDGAILKTVQLGARSAGAIDFEWDGTTDSGDAPGAGPFRIRVGAMNAEGETVEATPLVWAPVTAVAFDAGGEPVLTLPGIGQISPSAVLKAG